MTDFCDLSFSLTGDALPLDHGYALFGAVSRRLPVTHKEESWGIHPVRGTAKQPGRLELDRTSHLTLRLPASSIGATLDLVGAELDVDGAKVRCGAPRVWPLRPAAALQARLVTVASVIDVKAPEDEQRAQLQGSVRRKLGHLQLGMDPERVDVAIGRRHVLRVGPARPHRRSKGEVVDRDIVVGFQVTLTGLEAPASIAVQAAGIGGRRHMGCGVFVPAPRRVLA